MVQYRRFLNYHRNYPLIPNSPSHRGLVTDRIIYTTWKGFYVDNGGLIAGRKNHTLYFFLEISNYNACINLGDSHRAIQRLTSIIDNWAPSSFIQIDGVPLKLKKKANSLTNDIKVREACVRSPQIAGTILLAVSLGSKHPVFNFHVAEKFETSLILECDFCDHQLEAIRP